MNGENKLRDSLWLYGLFWLLISVSVWPGLGDSYLTIKQILFGLFLVAALMFSSGYLHIPKTFGLALTGLVIAYALSFILNVHDASRWALLEWCAYLLVLGLLLGFFRRHKDDRLEMVVPWVRASVLVVGFYWLAQELGFQPIPGLWHNDFAAASFGFQNLTAEFFGLSSLWFLGRFVDHPRQRRYELVYFGLCVIALSASASRANILALSLVTILALSPIQKWSLGLNRSSDERLRLRGSWVVIPLFVLGLALGLFFAKQPNDLLTRLGDHYSSAPFVDQAKLPPPADAPPQEVIHRLEQTKQETSSVRWKRLQNSWSMARDFPWGTGPGAYEFTYMRYRDAVSLDPEASESMVPRSPHNGYLELMIENGWLALGCLFALMAVLGYTFFVKKPESSSGWVWNWAWMSLLYLSVDALFAFPFEVPFPFFASLLPLAYVGSLIPGRCWEFSWRGSTRILVSLCFLGAFALSSIAAIGHRAPWPKSLVKQSCLLFPEHWRSCLDLAYDYLRHKDVEQAMQLAEAIAGKRPEHFPGQALLAVLHYVEGDDRAMCQAFQSYRTITGSSLKLHDLLGLEPDSVQKLPCS